MSPVRYVSYLLGPDILKLVGTRGFEPPASPTPRVRATPAPRPDFCLVFVGADCIRPRVDAIDPYRGGQNPPRKSQYYNAQHTSHSCASQPSHI